MKIIITGATGFVGRTVTRRLLSEGHSLCLLVRNVDKMKALFPAGNYEFVSLKEADWEEKISRWNPEVAIHLAAYFTGKADIGSAEKLVDSNLLFPVRLLCALKDTDCKAFVNTGTFTEYMWGDGKLAPNNLYSATKSSLRPILQYFSAVSGMKWINVIVYSPYGRKNDNKKVIDYLIDALDSEEKVGFSDGKQILDFIHVDDMASFYSRLIDRLDFIPSDEEFHLGTGKGHSIREVASVMEKVYGKKVNADWGKLQRNRYDAAFAVAPISKNLRLLDWYADISLEKGIEILKQDLG